MPRPTEDYIAAAQAAFEEGFKSEAARKRALDLLSRAYRKIAENLRDAIIDARSPANEEQNGKDYWDVTSDLHNVRDRHFDLAAKYVSDFEIVRDLIELRSAIKNAEIVTVSTKTDLEVKTDIVRKFIIDELERRKNDFVTGLEIGRLFSELYPVKNKEGEIVPSASLPVTVNAHIVHGHKGTIFVRHFFYLAGKLTPLMTIMAIAQQLDRDAQ